MTPDQPADLVLRGGRIATMDAARRWATALAVRDGRIVAVGPDGDVAAHRSARARGSSSSAAGPSRRASRTPTSIRSTAASPVLRCELHDTPRARGLPRGHRRVRREPPGRGLDPRRRLVHGRLPGRHAAPRGPRRDRVRTARSFLTNRDGHGAWVNTRALELAGIDRRRRPTRPTGGSSATRTARRAARSTKARWTSSSGSARRHAGRPRGGAAPRPGAPALARDHGLAGRDRRAAQPRSGPTSPSPRAAS